MARKTIIDVVTGASFLFTLIIGLILLYAQTLTTSSLFPENVELWNRVYTAYLVILSLALIGTLALSPKTFRAWVTANYWKSFLFRFLPVAVVSTFILILMKGLIKGAGSIDILSFIAYIPLPVLITHLFVVCQIEELVFGGLIYSTIEKRYSRSSAEIITILLFPLWHFAKTGGSWVVMLTYIPLRAGFNYTRNHGLPFLNRLAPKFFGATPRTQQANAGFHFGWNAFVIGLIKPLQI